MAPYMTPPRYTSDTSSPRLNNDPLLAGSPVVKVKSIPSDGTVGGFPVKFLEMVVSTSQIRLGGGQIQKTKKGEKGENSYQKMKRSPDGRHK